VTRGQLPQRAGLPGLNGGGAAAVVPPPQISAGFGKSAGFWPEPKSGTALVLSFLQKLVETSGFHVEQKFSLVVCHTKKCMVDGW